MSFSPSDYDGDDGNVHCPNCGGVHPSSYSLTVCDDPDCDVTGCHECLRQCEISSGHGWFCVEHQRLLKLPGIDTPMLGCTSCEKEQVQEALG